MKQQLQKHPLYPTAVRLYHQLRSQQVIPHAFKEWETYRKSLTTYLISLCQPGTTFAIFGAGRCNDLDLSALAAHFSHITLFDCDPEAMQEALEQYHLSGDSRITCVSSDFAGITEEDYLAYTTCLLAKVQAASSVEFLSDDSLSNNYSAEIANDLLPVLKQIFLSAHVHNIDFGVDTFDYSIAIGVHSQLCSMLEWIWRTVLSSYSVSDSTIFDQITAENPYFTSRLTSAILKATRLHAFFGCETRVLNSAEPIEGAWQTIEDLYARGRNGELEINSTALLVWPFLSAQDISYELALFEVHSALKTPVYSSDK